MVRAAAASLLLVSGLALGQAPDPGDFAPIDPIGGQVFPIGHLNDVLGAAQPADVKVPLLPDAADLEDVPELFVEGDGVRMPEERLDTVSP